MDALPKPQIMGIVNVTPDSFSGDGLFSSGDYVAAAVAQGKQMVADGADILDIGGESTRPGAAPVSSDEEIARTRPVIKALREAFADLPLSIDTMKPEVAKEALAAGATILNDVSGNRQDPAMRTLATSSGARLVLMHNSARTQATAQTQTIGGEYLAPTNGNILSSVTSDLADLASLAINQGVPREHIILDPGIGFGKTLEQNLQLINHLDRLAALGFPVLLGASRKSFIGRALGLPPEERLEGTAAATALGLLRGATVHRVHDVKFMTRLVRMMHALLSA